LTKIDFTPFIQERLVLLPEYNKKKTLLLDLDETLIHADFDERYVKHHKKICFKYQEEEVSVDIFIRPGAKEFLKKCAEIFEVFIFTASKKEYADACIDNLDPDRKIIKHRLYRDSCIPVNNKTYIKDLRIFVNRKQENLILVDNSFYSFCNQPRNGILINSFYDDPKDQELGNLVNYLENYLLTAQDIRVFNEQIFNFAGIMEQCLNVK
jgi:CTD small phosphatase-like protein 2